MTGYYTAPMNVLIVDDNEINRVFLKTALAGLAQVTTANDGDQAVELCTQTRFDLVLMDLRMPKLDGTAAAKLIRPLANRPRRLVAMSAETPDQPIEHLFDDVVTKPLSRQQLVKLLDPFNAAVDAIDSPFDDEAGLQATGGNGELLATLRRMLIRDLQTLPDAIGKAMTDGNYIAARDDLHKIAGAASYCGANELKSAALSFSAKIKAEQAHAKEQETFINAVDRLFQHSD